jgi:hypothetical protein
MIAKFSASSFISGVAIGVLATAAWFLGANASLFPASLSVATSPTKNATIPESGAVAVADQGAGAEVLVESVTVPPPGVWVAVREVNGSDLGNVLGALRVGGPRTQVSVPLLRDTEAGRSYAVELYRDDNNGQFDPALNSVYVDFDTGSRVTVYFKTKQ